MARDLRTEDSRACEHRALLHIWLSALFLVGAYAYSHGLETVVGMVGSWIARA